MALLALYRNMKSGWTDARRSPYEGYYQVWPDKEIRSYNLSELQLPVLICAFPELDGSEDKDTDVIRAARRVFLTLNKTAKSRNEVGVSSRTKRCLPHAKVNDVPSFSGSCFVQRDGTALQLNSY